MERAKQEFLAKVLESHTHTKKREFWLLSRNVTMPQGSCLIPFMGRCNFIR